MKNLLEQTQSIFKPDGLLSTLIEAYENRSGQLEMASAVAQILEGGKLVVEAETGIGKTLAYLVPAVLSRQKVVISTNTLNLQEQILNDAIPFIQQNIDPELSALCVKEGKTIYVSIAGSNLLHILNLKFLLPVKPEKKLNTGLNQRAPATGQNSHGWKMILPSGEK
jgi:ATP-dependent DNA helicase DinG